ncbi:hypothetical protein BH23GEM9_BH23GEM9_15930 [soil metagenome]
MELGTTPQQFCKLLLVRADCLDRQTIPELLGELDPLVRRQVAEVKESRSHVDNIAKRQRPSNRDHLVRLRAAKPSSAAMGDRAIVFEVAGEVDRGHPATADLMLDAVTSGEGSGQLFELVSHLLPQCRFEQTLNRFATRPLVNVVAVGWGCLANVSKLSCVEFRE